MTTTVSTSTLQRLTVVARDIKLSHSLFALPFALLATFLAAAHHLPADRGGRVNSLVVLPRLPSLVELGLIVVCMVLARTVAMTINRYADARLDALNPRTAGRAIPSGRVSPRDVLGVCIACAIGFVIATSGFYWLRPHPLPANPFPMMLSPIVLAWLIGYSFTKRFTWLCHLFLGSALAMSPVAAAIAIEPTYALEPDVYLLAVMVTCWVAGFDIIYALQDVQVDQRQGLHSMPSRLGVEPALWISRLLHLIALAALVGVAWFSPTLGTFFAIGIVMVAGLLIVEHALMWRAPDPPAKSGAEGTATAVNPARLDIAFFTLNGIISLLLGALGILDVVRSL